MLLHARARVCERFVLTHLAMACMCFMPSCRACNGSGASAESQKLQANVSCACFLLSCRQCTPEMGPKKNVSSDTEADTDDDSLSGRSEPSPTDSEGEDQGPSGINALGPQGKSGINASGPKCQCFMLGCLACTEGAVYNESSRKRKRRAKRELPPGHSKCSLKQELEIDARMHQGSTGFACSHADACATLAAAFVLVAQPAFTALEMIGRPRGERWDFLEIYSGCGNLTAAVCLLGLSVGPAVDNQHKPNGLRLDCLLESSQALLQAALAEARPRWVHVGPPCTFWCSISRWTAHATEKGWNEKRKAARTHWSFALHVLGLQEARGDKGSLEQPPGCVSWKLGMTRDFRQAHPTWELCKFPSCAYGMKHPSTGEPWLKMQAFLSNASLGSMCRPCACTVPHVHIKGSIRGGPRHGERCSTVAGEYPPEMCHAFAAIVQKHVRGPP